MRERKPFIVLFGMIVAITSICGTPLLSQPSPRTTILIGPFAEGSIGIGVAGDPIQVYGLSAGCGTFEAIGNAQGWRAGVEGRVVPALWNRIGLTGRIALENSSGQFTATPLDEQRILNEETGEVERIDREFRLDYGSTTFAIECRADYKLSDSWSVAVGLSVGYRSSVSFSQTDNVLGPGDRRFDDGQQTHSVDEGIPFAPQRWAFGPTILLTRLLPLKNGAVIAPHIALRSDLLSPAINGVWQTYSASVGASLLFNFSPTPPPPPLPPDQPASPPVPEVPLPQAKVNIYSLNDSGEIAEVTVIRASEVLYEQRLPILPSIYFDQNSSRLPDRYTADAAQSPEAAITTSQGDSLTENDNEWTLMKVNHHLPAILAERMGRNPKSVIQISASVSEDESEEEGERRSQRLKEMLIGASIPAERITIVPPDFKRSDERTEEGRRENRRIEIAAKSSAANDLLTEPVTLQRIVRDFSPPVIQIQPDYEAIAGVKDWELSILYNDSVMARYTRAEKNAGKLPDFNWRIKQRPGDTTLAPIVASFTLEDSLGRRSTAFDTIPVVLEEERSVVNNDVTELIDRERSNLWIIGFDYDSEVLSDRQKQELEIVAGKIRDSAEVTVTGYTDRIGTEEHNTLLSERRAESAATYLQRLLARKKRSGVVIEAIGGGVDYRLFDNSLPEGRRLSRSVMITVEQKAGNHSK